MLLKSKITKVMAFTAIISMAALIGCKGKHHGGMSEKHLEKMTEKISSELDLNLDQKSKLNNLKEAAKIAMTEIKSRRGADFNTIISQLKSDKISIDELKSFIQTKQETQIQVLEKVGPSLSDFHASLTSDQKKKLVEKLEKMKERFPDRAE